MYYFCTYFDRHYIVRARALYQSLARHANPFTLYMLCMDEVTYEAVGRLGLPNVVPISLHAFEDGDGPLLAAKQNRSLLEYYFTCTPSLPLYILDRFPGIDVLTYLDADLFFYSNPAPIFAELGAQSVLIVGHRFPPALQSWERFGIYNVGLLSFRNDASGRECLNWWRERCLEWCHDWEEDGRFADQKYLDDWPTRFRGVVVLQHRGAGLAPWNVSGSVLRDEAGSVLVDNQPLIFYHFHHLRRLTPYIFDPGLDACGAHMSATLRRRVYAPYLRELQALERQTDVKDFEVLVRHAVPADGKLDGDASDPPGRVPIRSWLRNTLLLIVGFASVSFCLLPKTGLLVRSKVAMAKLRGRRRPRDGAR